ncbi:hypothetical protein Csa_014906, partial [Cucumis sativus]
MPQNKIERKKRNVGKIVGRGIENQSWGLKGKFERIVCGFWKLENEENEGRRREMEKRARSGNGTTAIVGSHQRFCGLYR